MGKLEKMMAKSYKVLMLVENAPVPLDSRVWPEATTLRDQGFQVSIIGPKASPDYESSYSCIDGIYIYRYRVPTIGNTYIAYLVEYSVALFMTFLLSLKVWVQHGFDVIHAANPPDLFFIIGLFYRLFGKKFVFDQHDLSPELLQVKFKRGATPLHRLLLFLERCSYHTAHLVITPNLSLKRFALERGHCPPDKIIAVRNGSRLNYMRLVAPEPELKRGRPYLLAYEGVIGVQDGVEYTLLALHDLVHKRGRQDVSLVLIGSGSNLAIIQKLVHELQLDQYVTFTGWISREDVMRYLTVADVGLIPDPQNGLNEYCTLVKTMDYMAMGKPIVAFDLAETRYSAQDAALYATPNLVEDFASKIEALLDDKALRLRMGALGRKRNDETLCWEETKKELLSAYEVLLPRYNQPT
jgi:glycosyltransferase involved in cell wall biosynthesis